MNEWTNEMSDKAIYAVIERRGILQNMTLLGQLKKLENAMHQAFKPTWGGPNPDVLKRQIARAGEIPRRSTHICEDGKHRTMYTQRQMCGFLDDLRYKALAAKIEKPASHDLVPREVGG